MVMEKRTAFTMFLLLWVFLPACGSGGGEGPDAFPDGDVPVETTGDDPAPGEDVELPSDTPDTPVDTPPDEGTDVPPGFCSGKADGAWCDGSDLVQCTGGAETGRESCPMGCETVPGDEPDRCRTEPVCIEEPGPVSPDPPIEVCNYMDWQMSSDGFYLISQFGTTNDPTTMGHTTSCGFLQGHYDYNGCIYDVRSSTCLPGPYEIPWIRGDVDYDYDMVIAAVEANMGGDVPFPEYFYVACAQRFGCGSLLRVTNTENDRCVVVYTEDGGPGATYEDTGYGERRILDSSPAVVTYLEVEHVGWANSTLMYVEWGLPGDVPGQACTRCESSPVAGGYPWGGTAFDVNHMMSLDCRPAVCGDGICGPGEDHASCPGDCPVCEAVPAEGRIIDEIDPCFARGGTASYWHTESDGYGGSLIWTYTTSAAAADNHGIWSLELAVEGTYLVEAYTDADFAGSRQAAYQVTHAGTTETFTVDQTAVDGWNPIGTIHFSAGGGQSVRLDDNTGEPYADRVQIAFDAIRLTPP
jgi:hypothetical protein